MEDFQCTLYNLSSSMIIITYLNEIVPIITSDLTLGMEQETETHSDGQKYKKSISFLIVQGFS